MRLILASTSLYRRALLERLRIPFETIRPEVDETPQPTESPKALALRLAQCKAESIAARFPESWVIGSDQVAELAGEPLGKPGGFSEACGQLRRMSGKTVNFHTALCLTNGSTTHIAIDLTRVCFRTLTEQEINRYVEHEQPLDCAGSFKSEGLGICLFDSITSTDPTALIGLPMIVLCRLLRASGFELP